MSVTVKIKRLREGITLPQQMTEGASGYDIFAPHTVRLIGGHQELVRCGFAVEIPRGYELQIRPRSGLALHYGITVVNSPATIDSDYRGEVGVILKAPHPHDIQAGERIAQLVLQAVPTMILKEVEETSTTKRGEGGFGSTT